MNGLLITLTLGSALLLGSCWPPPPPPSPTPTPTPPPPTKVNITYPVDGAKVDPTEIVKGTSERIPDGQVIWVVVFVHKVNRNYPQNNPADVQASGDWASSTSIGVPKDTGLKFDLIAVLADKEGQNAFNRYLVEARDKKDWPGLERLPEGVKIYDRVSVTRK